MTYEYRTYGMIIFSFLIREDINYILTNYSNVVGQYIYNLLCTA